MSQFRKILLWKHTVIDKSIFVSWTISFPMPISYHQFSICQTMTITYSNNFIQLIFFLSIFLWTWHLQKYLTHRSINLFLQYMCEINIIIIIIGATTSIATVWCLKQYCTSIRVVEHWWDLQIYLWSSLCRRWNKLTIIDDNYRSFTAINDQWRPLTTINDYYWSLTIIYDY